MQRPPTSSTIDPQQVAQLSADYTKVCADNARLREERDALKQQLDWFQRQLFGRKSEKRLIENPDQLNLGALLGDASPPTEPAETEKISYSGEYINYTVADLLDKLHIEFTKSRPRHSNDNGLVESKNGSVVRKLYGYMHIPQQYADEFSTLNSDQVFRYVNFHRPCYFPSTITDDKGKEKKKYRYEDMMTPFEKLLSLPRPSQYLKSGVTIKKLNAFASEMTDNEAAEQINSARDQLFKQLHERLQISA